MCVQRFDDSLNSAIHITYRISLRSSSMPEPRDPLLKVLCYCNQDSDVTDKRVKDGLWRALVGRDVKHAAGVGTEGSQGSPKQQR